MMSDDMNLEKFLERYPGPVTIEQTKKILSQLHNCICKINNKNGKGTGFFCYIPYKNKKIPVMMTNNHIIDEQILEGNNNIRVTFDDDKKYIDIKLNNKRKIYTSGKDKYDTTIIEIKEEEGEIESFLELDDCLFEDGNINLYNESVYTLHYPKSFDKQKAAVSYGILKEIENEYKILHLCCTLPGSSGSPILNISNNKIIGIHKESSYKFNYNVGILLKNPINEFLNDYNIKKNNKKNEINMVLKIEKKDIKKDIYFLDNTNGNYYINGKAVSLQHNNLIELNKSNVELFINHKQKLFTKYFNPEKEGLYEIKLQFEPGIKNCSFMFCDCKNIINLDLSSFDTKNATNMSYMFHGCENINSLNLTSFVTKNVTDMNNMFCYCESLTDLDLSSFDTTNVINMSCMFSSCKSIVSLNLSSFCTKNVTNMNKMFSACLKMSNIIMSSFNTKNVTNMNYMFSACKSLQNLKLTCFNTKKVTNTSYMFSVC